MKTTLYDTIGANYNATRKADPHISEKIFQLLNPGPAGTYLDIGCGTGNYLHALTNMGLSFYGIDPSETMLQAARLKNPQTTFINGKAENIALPDNFFSGAIAVLTIHHWESLRQGLKEIHRVLKPGVKIVFFSFTPEQMKGYWLYHYFPAMIESAMKIIPTLKEMESLLIASGFTAIDSEPYFVQDGLQDHFMYSNKHRPEMYLSAEVRNNASAFSALAAKDEVEHGLVSLKMDIASGKIGGIMEQYKNNLGDYLFITAIKSGY